jgi:hypothetical protein
MLGFDLTPTGFTSLEVNYGKLISNFVQGYLGAKFRLYVGYYFGNGSALL